MTQTTLEIVEEVKTKPKPPLKHAYCRNCMRLAAPFPVQAKCGGGMGLAHGAPAGSFRSLPASERCVVCEDLAGEPCQRCGF